MGMDMEESDEDDILKLVVTKQHGGPYEDEDYEAGLEAGLVLGQLEHMPDKIDGIFRKANVPMLDLIAMYKRYTTEQQPIDNHDDRVYLTFRRV